MSHKGPPRPLERGSRRSPSVPRATGAPGLCLHGLCVPLLRSAGWDDRLVSSRLRGARTTPGGSSKSTVRRSFRSSRPRWKERPPKPEPPAHRFSRRLVAPGAAGRPEKLPQVAGGEPAGPRPSPPLPSRHPLRGPPRTPEARERVPLGPRPHPSGALAGGHSPRSTRGPRSPRARVRRVPATQLAQLRERGSASGVQSQVT